MFVCWFVSMGEREGMITLGRGGDKGDVVVCFITFFFAFDKEK